jgi:type II secretory pathway component GspD/PulD (secretin)
MKNAVLAALLACSIVATPAAAADRLTIDARDAEIGDVIRLIGSESGTNIVPDASVKAQRITFHLNGVDAATALATLAQAYNLQIHRAGTVVIVGDAATMNRRYLDTGIAGGAQTTVFTLTRAKPDEVATALLAALPPGTVALADKRTTSVILTTSESATARAQRIVDALDRDVPPAAAP